MGVFHSPSDSGLTQEALDNLLHRLHSDHTQAAEEYLRLHDNLASYFEFEKCADPEDLADEVLDRVARKLNQGEQIDRLGAYSLGVARLVALESRREEIDAKRKSRQIARVTEESRSSETERSLSCLDRCLTKLPAESRSIILGYYSEDHRERIENRKNMAADLGIEAVALRNRALRLRANLQICMKRCFRSHGGSGLCERTTSSIITPRDNPGRRPATI
jgi:DNA-directed RNA polymerase specialized sigma24 family protein